MGRRGPLPRREGQKRPRDSTIVPMRTVKGGLIERPKITRDWLEVTQRAWDAYWRSDLVQVVTEVDLQAVRRLFDAYDRYDRLMDILLETPTVEARGEVRAHPAEMMAHRLDGQILKLEAELGLTPLARQRLGIAVGKATMTADEMNRRFRESDGGSNQTSDILQGEFEEVD